MMKVPQAESAVLSEINITPFTDVLLVLLIIFMILASLAIPPGFERSLPCNCNSRVPAAPPRHITVTVTQRGGIFVEGRPVGVNALYPLLAQMHERVPSENLSLYADVKAPYGSVIRVIDAAKAGGIANVSFITQ